MIRQWGWKNQYPLSTGKIGRSEESQSTLAKRLMLIWLLGLLVLLPVDIINLPLNMTLVDYWILMALPILWLSFVRGPQVISLSYAIPMWLILIGSFASTFAAPAPRNSMIVILKEVYIFIWFITIVAVLSRLNERYIRIMMIVWSGVVLLHGCLMIAQFLSPDLWRITASFVGRSSEYDRFRPSGFFPNANSAAFFQLLGFVPLLLAGFSKKTTIILGLLLLFSMLVTGSMGAALAFTAGLVIAVIVIALSGNLAFIGKIFVQVALAVLLIGGVLYVVASQNQRYRDHFEYIIFGRAERSSEGRFDLWQRGKDVLLDRNQYIWGIGPENFRVVDGRDKQLHNDFLAFTVERGLIATVGLVLFAVIAMGRATYLFLLNNRYHDRSRLVVVVFLAAMVATIVESLTHQTFHSRQLWLILALQEALLYKMTVSEGEFLPSTRPPNRPPSDRQRFAIQRDVTSR